MKHLTTIIATTASFAALIALSSVSAIAQCTLPFNPAEATMISEPENLMTHAPSIAVSKDGEAYIAYYRDNTQQKEDSNMLSVEMKIVHFPIESWKNPDIKRIDFMKCGDTVGDYTQQGRAPYDPILHIDGNHLNCIFSGVVDGEPTMVMRRMKLGNDKLENRVNVCKLSYPADGKMVTVPMNNTGVKKCFADLGITAETTGFFNSIMDKTFIEYNGWLYNVIFVWCCPESRPVVVRTRDCIHFEVVFFCPEYQYGCTECTMGIVNDEFYIQARSARPKDKSKAGTWLGKYSPDGVCLEAPRKIGNVESRPAMIVLDGKLYSFYNVTPNVRTAETPKGVNRSHIRISNIDSLAQPVYGWDITGENSLQYYALASWNDKTFIVFVEDRQHKADKSRKGNVSICEIDL